jgi:hypothetical protein
MHRARRAAYRACDQLPIPSAGVRASTSSKTRPLPNDRIVLRTVEPVSGVELAPSGKTLPRRSLDGVTWATVPEVAVHEAVVFTTDGQVS